MMRACFSKKNKSWTPWLTVSCGQAERHRKRGGHCGRGQPGFLIFSAESVPCGHSIPRPPIASNHPRFRRKRGVAPNNGVHLWPVMGAKDPWRRVITLAPCNSPIWFKKAVRDPSGRPNVVTSGPSHYVLVLGVAVLVTHCVSFSLRILFGFGFLYSECLLWSRSFHHCRLLSPSFNSSSLLSIRAHHN